MAKAAKFVRGRGSSSVLKDYDWIVIIGSLLHDRTTAARQLAERLLGKTKHGRQVRILRLVSTQKPTIVQMQKATKMSRRTIFRYLNSLEEYGVRFCMDDQFRYGLDRMPKALDRLL